MGRELLQVLPTRNKSWGFWGELSSMEGLSDRDVDSAWDVVFEELLRAFEDATVVDSNTVREWLDSRAGRHFADTLSFHVDDFTNVRELRSGVNKVLDDRKQWKWIMKTMEDVYRETEFGAYEEEKSLADEIMISGAGAASAS